MSLRVYTYAKCDTCRKAVKYLRERNIPFQEIPIRETPPTLPELKKMLQTYGGDIRKLFNTSGGDYKAMGLGAKLNTLSENELLALLAGNGNLVKRPFLLGKTTNLVGFKEFTWDEAFGKSL